MKKVELTLQQLCMLYLDRSATLYCEEGEKYFDANWFPSIAFKLPKAVRELKFTHSNSAPDPCKCSYYLAFDGDPENNEGSEYFTLAGDSNEICANVCKMYVEMAKVLRDCFVGEAEELAAQRLAQCFILKDDDILNPFGRTEIVYRGSGLEQVIATVDTAINFPFELIEQRKTDSNGKLYSWGHDEYDAGDRITKEAPLSKLFAHFIPTGEDAEAGAEAIEVPLRIDGTVLPFLIFDYVMILGQYEPEGTQDPPKKRRARSVDTDDAKMKF